MHEERFRLQEEGEQCDIPTLLHLLTVDHEYFLQAAIPELEKWALNRSNGPLRQFLQNLHDELLIHFRMEERLVFPVILSSLDGAGAMAAALRLACDHMRDDHRSHLRHILVLQEFQRTGKQGGKLEEMLEEFCSSMRFHADLENRRLFQNWAMLQDY